MLNGSRIANAVVVWFSILYVICVLIAWIIPSVYTWGASNMVHFGMTITRPNLTITGVILGLIIWDIIAYLATRLFVWIYNKFN